MKRFLLTCGLFGMGLVALLAADLPPEVEKTPLPAGPLLSRAPAYAQWQIAFTYAGDKSGNGNAAGTSTTSVVGKPDGSFPRLVAVTLTRPLWHAVQVAVDGTASECWDDGYMPYEIGQQKIPIVINMSVPGTVLPHFLDHRGGDFPDVGWVSAQTYLGIQKGTTYWVFQQQGDDGAMVWIDLNTRLPVRWQKGYETRDFKFLTPPSERLTLPPEIEKLSKEQAYIRLITSDKPPRGA